MKIMNDMSVTEIIRKRKSSRTYVDKPLEREKKEQVLQFASTLGSPPFGSAVRFEIVDLDLKFTGKVYGTYGVIKGAETFLACIVKKGPGDMEDAGYLFEQVILFATAMGLDTCWMGASFSRSLFSDKMALASDEMIPVVSPMGYKAGRPSIMDVVFHVSAGAKKRKSRSDLFFHRTWDAPLEKKDAGSLDVPLEMVRLAPSAVNKQPWRLLLDEDGVHFFLMRTNGFKRMFAVDLQRIDMGIAMCHFELAAVEEGVIGRWKKGNSGPPPAADGMEYIASWEFE
ncbi:MAG: nitroreductase family protein [Desulfosalsimonadaceae bacterium]